MLTKIRRMFSKPASTTIGCGALGHKWVWQEKIPSSIDKELRDHDGPHLFEEPFRHGYAWACERDYCK